MEKFDPKKEKIPKSKDSQNFMKFLSDKYLDRKYASKDLEKELSFLNVERIGDKGENLSEPNSSSHDSSTPGKKITPGENMHSPQKNPDSLNEKSKLENMDLNLQNSDPFSSNEKNDIIYPNMTSNPLEKPSSPGVGLECEVFKENGQNDRNLFFFENFNIPCDNKVDINDWGFIWDNENKPNPIESEIKSVKDLDKPEAEYVENTEPRHSNNDQEVFNLIKDERLDSNLTKSDPKEVKKADWEFPVEFDLVSRNTNTTTSSNTSPDNITNLSQNLCGIYSSAKAENKANTNNKKTFDDLERYLSDSAYITPAGKKPVAVPLSVNNTSITCAEGNLNYTNQFPNTQNTPSINPHMMMNYSYNINSGNNNYQMHPKSQTDYFTTNDREPINNNNTAYVVNNANYRSTTLGSASDNLDYHFNLLNLNTQRQNVHVI